MSDGTQQERTQLSDDEILEMVSLDIERARV